MLWLVKNLNSSACINKIWVPFWSRLQNCRQTWPVLVAPRPAATSEPSQPLESTDRSQISASSNNNYRLQYLTDCHLTGIRLHNGLTSRAPALGSQPLLICKSALSKPASWRATGVYHLRNYRLTVCLFPEFDLIGDFSGRHRCARAL